MKIAFHSPTLGVRGSENAIWDYAEGNETILGNRSVMAVPKQAEMAKSATFLRWSNRFPILVYRSRRELAELLRKEGIGLIYMIKPGPYDGLLIPGVINCVHSMFLSDEFHGDRFAYVSAWASRVMTGKEESYVPHLVSRHESCEDLRLSLGIPAKARVFGRHGGWETFNIPFARKAVAEHARNHPRDHFVFLNTRPIRGTERLANFHYLPATIDPGEKAKFLATCDVMIHARDTGETFGLAVGEFAVLGKPVVTYSQSKEKAHLEMLGTLAHPYENAADLCKLLQENLSIHAGRTKYTEYADPKKVMEIFRNVYLEPI